MKIIDSVKEVPHIITKGGDDTVSVTSARLALIMTSIAVAFASSRVTRTRTLAGKPSIYGFF